MYIPTALGKRLAADHDEDDVSPGKCQSHTPFVVQKTCTIAHDQIHDDHIALFGFMYTRGMSSAEESTALC